MAVGVFQTLTAAVLFFSMCHQQVTGLWPGSVKLNGRCFVLKQERLNWMDAQNACNNIGGNLATISSKDVLYGVVAAYNVQPDDFIWIGANYRANPEQLLWVENFKPTTEIKPDWWLYGYPGDEWCAVIEPEHPYLNTMDCYTSYFYLCIEPGSRTTMCTEPTTSTTTPTFTTTITTTEATTEQATTEQDTTVQATTVQATTTQPTMAHNTSKPATTRAKCKLHKPHN